MTTELTILTLALLLQTVQFALMAVPANLELGVGKTASPRDPERMGGKSILEQLSTKTGRLARAMNNHFEALILFAPAVLIIEISGQNSGFTALCAITYLAARVLYIPAYYYGWTPGRSYIWFVGFGATVAMLISALF